MWNIIEGGVDEKEEEVKEKTYSPTELLDEIVGSGEKAIINWHNAIIKEPPSFDAFLDHVNNRKNRFPNVILYDDTRVRLKGKPGEDYFHASYVDSYDTASGYILAQAPFDDGTEADFWRMVYQCKIRILVLLTGFEQSGRRMSKHFWPAPKQEKEYSNGAVRVTCLSVEQGRDCDNYEMQSLGPGQRGKGGVKMTVLHYKKWTDDAEIPDSILEFRASVKIADLKAKNDARVGPICLMCPTGVHRAGTFAVIDILLERLTAEKKVGLMETVSIVRKQRYGCMTHFSHYSSIAEILMRQAVSSGLVDTTRIGRK